MLPIDTLQPQPSLKLTSKKGQICASCVSISLVVCLVLASSFLPGITIMTIAAIVVTLVSLAYLVLFKLEPLEQASSLMEYLAEKFIAVHK